MRLGPHGLGIVARAGSAVSPENVRPFALCGLLGLAVDIIAFQLLLAIGADFVLAHVASFFLSALSDFVLNARWTFGATASPGSTHWLRFPRFLAICLMALSLRGGVLSAAIEQWNISPGIAIFFGIAVSAVVNFIGSAFYIFPSASRVPRRLHWRMLAAGALLFALALRFAYLGSVNLIPEEAYYWNYAQHLDLAYLDHPPMVAWMIWLGTEVFGNTEFAVRLGAYLCWSVAAIFSFRLARNLYGDAAAFANALLFATLPYFFAMGMIMTPDAPLLAAWAAALYFLERALLAGQRAAWLYVGIFFGFGLLSKYTIALLGLATLVFIAFDPRSRVWFRRLEPYVAVLVAAAIFSPVVLWNANHDWASFMFQGPHRLEVQSEFSLFKLLSAILLFLTPVGFTIALIALVQRIKWPPGPMAQPMDRKSLFEASFMLVPLSVFLFFSLFHAVKLNWTGPLWLALLPFLARDMSAYRKRASGWRGNLRRAWGPTIAVALVLYGALLHFFTLGIPGIPYSGRLRPFPVAWREFGAQAAAIEEEIKSTSRGEPLRVGMDKHFLSSEMAFYDRLDNDGAATTAGRSLLGLNSLMYDSWYPAPAQRGRTLILFALEPESLSGPGIERRFGRMDQIHEKVVYKRAARAGRFYYRVGYDFRPG